MSVLLEFCWVYRRDTRKQLPRTQNCGSSTKSFILSPSLSYTVHRYIIIPNSCIFGRRLNGNTLRISKKNFFCIFLELKQKVRKTKAHSKYSNIIYFWIVMKSRLSCMVFSNLWSFTTTTLVACFYPEVYSLSEEKDLFKHT